MGVPHTRMIIFGRLRDHIHIGLGLYVHQNDLQRNGNLTVIVLLHMVLY